MDEKKLKELLCVILNDVQTAIENNNTQAISHRIMMLRQDIKKINEHKNRLNENYTVENIKWLREQTGMGMIQCKKALIMAEGDLDRAIVIIKQGGTSGGII